MDVSIPMSELGGVGTPKAPSAMGLPKVHPKALVGRLKVHPKSPPPASIQGKEHPKAHPKTLQGAPGPPKGAPQGHGAPHNPKLPPPNTRGAPGTPKAAQPAFVPPPPSPHSFGVPHPPHPKWGSLTFLLPAGGLRGARGCIGTALWGEETEGDPNPTRRCLPL